jgi:hypothetical protein
LTALLTAPALLLTWYWRTVYKERELGHKREELTGARFSDAAKLLADPGMAARLGGIYALGALARDYTELYRDVVVETIAAFIRHRMNPAATRDKLDADTALVPKLFDADRLADLTVGHCSLSELR